MHALYTLCLSLTLGSSTVEQELCSSAVQGVLESTNLLQDLAAVLPGTDGGGHSAKDSVAQRPVHERARV